MQYTCNLLDCRTHAAIWQFIFNCLRLQLDMDSAFYSHSLAFPNLKRVLKLLALSSVTMAWPLASQSWWYLPKVPRPLTGLKNIYMGENTKVLIFYSMFMLVPLIFGIGFALGHHLFFTHLSGSAVPSTNLIDLGSMQLSTQQVNLALGNALAFLVKTCLGTAVSIAYIQLFWAAISRKPQTISAVDIMFSSLSNVFMVGNRAVWWQHPLLLLPVLTVWYVAAENVDDQGYKLSGVDPS